MSAWTGHLFCRNTQITAGINSPRKMSGIELVRVLGCIGGTHENLIFNYRFALSYRLAGITGLYQDFVGAGVY